MSSLAWLICSAAPLALALTSWRLQTALEMTICTTNVYKYISTRPWSCLQTDSEMYNLQFTCISVVICPLTVVNCPLAKGNNLLHRIILQSEVCRGQILQEVLILFFHDKPPTNIIVHQAECPREVLGWLSSCINNNYYCYQPVE